MEFERTIYVSIAASISISMPQTLNAIVASRFFPFCRAELSAYMSCSHYFPDKQRTSVSLGITLGTMLSYKRDRYVLWKGSLNKARIDCSCSSCTYIICLYIYIYIYSEYEDMHAVISYLSILTSPLNH